MKTKLFSLFLMLAISIGSIYADRVKIGDLYYYLNDENKTASVTGHSSIWGDISILDSVTYNAETYRVTSIVDYAFEECENLTSIEIPNSVTSIGHRAFDGCTSLESVTIPNSVTSIGFLAFFGCNSLPVINNLRYADTYLVEAVDQTLTSYTIKEGTIWIGDAAFNNCKGLTSVTIPNSVTSIGERAFDGCTSLESVTIPDSVTSIGDYAFFGCNSLPVINNLRYADTYLVGAVDKKLTTCTIKEGTKWIGYYAFVGCSNLTSITIPNSVTSIEFFAFWGCTSLTSIEIPNSVTDIGYSAFSNCSSLISVTIPNSVTSIGESAFSNCSSLTSVTIPNSVTSIGYEAFSHCTGLISVTIPNSVTNIGSEAFSDCTGLTSVTCYATTPPSLGYKVFNGVDCSQIPLYVPQESIDTYKASDQWKEFNPILPIQNPEGIDNVNSSVKHNTSKLIRDGKVYILHGDCAYTLQGQRVR